MTLELEHLTLDAVDAEAAATFWAEALGRTVAPDATSEVAQVGGPARPADAPSWLFVRVPEGKQAKNRLHVDLRADDLAAEVARLEGLGASRVHEKREWDAHWFTVADPEGSEFCVVGPGRS